MKNNFITVAEAAEILSVSKARVRVLIADGRIEAVRFGLRTLMVHPVSVRRFAKLPIKTGGRKPAIAK